MQTFLGMASIIGRMADDHPGDGGHPILGTVWRILTILVRASFLWMVAFLRKVTNVGMVPLLEMVAVFRIFIILKDGYLIPKGL